ncbi:MAG: hypothetical protein AAF650_01080 [Pseudomonadota bacterium]
MLIAAAALLILMSVFHSLVGERAILRPIKEADNLPPMWGERLYTFRTIQATSHLVSALWLGLAVYFVALALAPGEAMRISLLTFGGLFAGLAIVPLMWNSGKHKSYIPFGLISAALFASAFL